MPDYDDDDVPRDLVSGRMAVRRPVYNEAMKILDQVPAGERDTFETVRGIGDDHKAAGEEEKADFWYEVADYLEWRASVAEDAETIILEDGEEWDPLAGKKIRGKKEVKRGNRRRRSGKGT